MAQDSTTDSIDNHFYNIEHEMDQRFHSLEIELDSLVDCLKISNSKSIYKMKKTEITKSKVGELLFFNSFYKVKSIDFVDYCGIIPTDMPFYPYAFRNGILHVLTWCQDTYVFTIYYSPTNVVTFSFTTFSNLFDFSLDDSKIYFHCGYKVKYICDYTGRNAVLNRDFCYNSKSLNKRMGLLSAVFFKIESIIFNDLYVIVFTGECFIFFHKNTLLFSHQIKNTFLFLIQKTSCIGDYLLYVSVTNLFYAVLNMNGLEYDGNVNKVQHVYFKFHLFDGGIVKEYGIDENDYVICEVKGNVIWYKPKRRGKKLIKMIF